MNKVTYFSNYLISCTEGGYAALKYRLELLIGNIYIVINKIKAFIKDKVKAERARVLAIKNTSPFDFNLNLFCNLNYTITNKV